MQSHRRDDAEPFVRTIVQGDCMGNRGAVVEPFVETVIRLPSILVLYVSRALELQMNFR